MLTGTIKEEHGLFIGGTVYRKKLIKSKLTLESMTKNWFRGFRATFSRQNTLRFGEILSEQLSMEQKGCCFLGLS